MLSNYDLEELCNNYNVPLNNICMKNELGDEPINGNYIINLQSSGGNNTGSHWLGLVLNGNDAYYFDSFGASPSTEIVEFVQRRPGCRLIFNNWIVQHIKSSNCGYYVLAFLIYMENNIKTINTFNKFINGFKNDTKMNDKILKSFFIEQKLRPFPKLIKRLLRQK